MKFSSLLLSVLLFSTIVSADIYVSPFYINFGYTKVDQFGFRKDITVTNRGPTATYVSVSGNCYGEFNMMNYCMSYLNPNYSCSVSVEFRPRSVGSKSCSIYIREDGGYSDSVQVTGTAYK